ncbi:hypothetical protein [Brachyspira sp. SAP_772]|uniref:hypothetical protein n=1 Tax=Brachyspira sp. SAP_772 TaxID=2608385 RepID=UPI0012F4D680|nr:hypothetical protein [Brachyspira sp. SAP_772]
MRRIKKDREKKFDIKGIITILFVIVLTMGMILFIMNAPDILNKYDVVNNKSETMDKYSKNNDLLSNNKKDNLVNLIIDFLTPSRHHKRFPWIPESLFFRVTIMFFLSFSSSMFSALAINEIKKEGFKKKDLKMYFILLLWISMSIFVFLMLKDNIITAKEYLSIAAGIILGLLLAKS